MQIQKVQLPAVLTIATINLRLRRIVQLAVLNVESVQKNVLNSALIWQAEFLRLIMQNVQAVELVYLLVQIKFFI